MKCEFIEDNSIILLSVHKKQGFIPNMIEIMEYCWYYVALNDIMQVVNLLMILLF